MDTNNSIVSGILEDETKRSSDNKIRLKMQRVITVSHYINIEIDINKTDIDFEHDYSDENIVETLLSGTYSDDIIKGLYSDDLWIPEFQNCDINYTDVEVLNRKL